jgi:filamentous hemagglutinin family protein
MGVPVTAQIVPDETLGAERSRLIRNLRQRNRLIDRIEGGAERGSVLFHSFREFNVNNRQNVYFANPAGIEHILSRVTGINPSHLLGTLGIDGNASLYLINPNGILFGPNARLDVNGSFLATTGDDLLLDNGWAFSAVNPEAPPLLDVNLVPGVQYGGSVPIRPGSTITSQGNLAVGGDLTLLADRLELSGTLQAGADLALLGQTQLVIRDTPVAPFQAIAQGDLRLAGNAIDIFALSHPHSGLFAGGDLVLRSPQPVIGDTRYYAGGNFRIEQAKDSPGAMISPNDPVIRSNGDVSFASYSGASLHILAGGSVTIDRIEITDADPANGLVETITRSDGAAIAIDGSTRPTLDVRAGVSDVGLPVGLTGTPSPVALQTDPTATIATITINQITVTPPDGLVLLSNQYNPNPALDGSIRVGTIAVSNEAGGGDVILDSRGNIRVSDRIESVATTGTGGDIALLAEQGITLVPAADPPARFTIRSAGSPGGAITLSSGARLLAIAGDIFSSTTGSGTGGDVQLAGDRIVLQDLVLISELSAGATGQSGNLTIDANNVTIDFATILTDTQGIGNAGDVTITVGDRLAVSDAFLGSAVGIDGIGNSGDFTIQTGSLTATTGAQIGSFTAGQGNAGNVTVSAQGAVSLEGVLSLPDFFAATGLFSSVAPGAIGNGGDVSVTAQSLDVLDGAEIRASTEGVGNAGSIRIATTDYVRFDGATIDALLGTVASTAVSEVVENLPGAGGNIRIDTPILELTNGGFISVSTAGEGAAGNVQVNTNTLVLSGFASTSDSLNLSLLESVTQETLFLREQRSGLFANTLPGSTGDGGSIFVNADTVTVENGAVIFAGSSGAGTGGDIAVDSTFLEVANQSAIFTQTISTDGGNIALAVDDLLVLRDNSQISTTAGTAQAGGDGGNIRIDTRYLLANGNSDITANAFTGNGGNISITAEGILGIEFRDQLTDGNDITATSEFGVDGVVEINEPDVDPGRGIVELPEDVVDASRLIARGCSASGGAIAQELGEFTVTGRGGLPPDPTERLSNDTILVGWETLEEMGDVGETVPPADAARSPLPPTPATRILEAQELVTDGEGQVMIVAGQFSAQVAPSSMPHLQSPLTCAPQP